MVRIFLKHRLSLCVLLLLASSASRMAFAQTQSGQTPSQSAATASTTESATDTSPDVTVFSHPEDTRWWLSGQMNIITQGHPSFPALYSGPNSMQPQAQVATSRVFTLYSGLELTPNTQAILDIESAGGHGLSGGVGIAGFPDLDVVRTPELGQPPYLARFLIERTIPLGGGSVQADRDFLSLSPSLPARRLELWAGKFSTVDFFDENSVGSDSHLQFMNWAIDNNGAYDYAANTRGYTWGAMIEYDNRRWGARFAEAMMPKVANGENLDADLARAHSENYEVEFYPTLLRGR
ncbi:MAG TPA: carbohydrate porin, partial [Terriglobia bacterium]|nr:carbohydrate porin [Terriglobia bacterium]